MAIKTVAQMFGDNAGNGAAVPYSTTNPPGTSSPNRGIQFGEQLTAAIANRTHVALCLNDEDLNTRLVSWETGGLNAAYRLGAVNTPGGGRTVNIDAGPVELTANHASLYTKDRANAQLRINHNADSIDGALGLDVHAEHQAKPFATLLHRHQQDLSSYNIADTDTGTLNAGGANSARLFMAGGEDVSVLILGVDMVEILNTVHAGLYVVVQKNTGDPGVSLQTLSGTTPVFTADTAVNYRVWRSLFRTSARNGATVPTGVVMAGTLRFNDDPVLTLVADAVAPYDVSNTGARYALQVLDRNLTKKMRIASTGAIQSSDGALPSDGGVFGHRIGHYHRHSAGHSVAFGSYGVGGYGSGSADNTKTSYGLIGLEARSNFPNTGIACVNQFVDLSSFAPAVGAAFYISPNDPSNSKAGVYFVVDASLGASASVMGGIDGANANFVPGTCSVTALTGMTVGQFYALGNNTSLTYNLPTSGTGVIKSGNLSAVRIQAPTQNDNTSGSTCLSLLNTTIDHPELTAYLRCVAAPDLNPSNDDFAVMAGGLVTARGTIRAPEIFGTTKVQGVNVTATTTLQCATDVTIPGPAATKFRDFPVGVGQALMTIGGVTGWVVSGNPMGPFEAFSTGNSKQILYDITNDLSHITGDILCSFRVVPGQARATVGDRVQMNVIAQNVSTGASTTLTDSVTASTAVTDNGTASAQTMSFTLAAYSMNRQTTRLFVQFRSGVNAASFGDTISGGVISQYGQSTPYVKQAHN